MAQGSFAAQVSAWVAETKARQEAVFRESVQRTIELAQAPISAGGNMPVKTGFLRASGFAVIGEELQPLQANPNPETGKFTYDEGAVSLVIAQAGVNDTITFGYSANYARPQEYGSHGRAGRRFVGLAAQQWPQVVAAVSADAQTRSFKA